MSTKTVTKRIALATVVALGAGVLSLVSVTSASAANTGILNTGYGAIIDPTTTGLNGSVGILSTSFAAGSPDLISVTMLSTGRMTVSGPAAKSGYYTVSAGATIITNTSGDTIGVGANTDSSTATNVNTTNQFVVTPTGAVGSTFTVNGYTNSTKATLVSIMTVTIAGASVAGVVSPANSYVYWSGTSGYAQSASTDLSTGSATTTGNPLYLEVALNDAYGSAITSTSGALTVTATAGAFVSYTSASANTTSGTYSTAVSGASPALGVVRVTEATAGAGWSGTVTVTYNGVVVATKSGTIAGLASKIVGTGLVVGRINATTDTAISYQAYDNAGNVVVIAPASLSLASTSNTAAVTAVAAASGGATYASNSSSGPGYLQVTGGTTAGSSNLVLSYTRTDGVVVSSNSFPVTVGNTAASYTATFDKSKYVPGDIATLKVKFLDSKGNAAASNSTLYTIGANTANYIWNASITVPQLTQVGTAGTIGAAGSNVYGASGNVAPDASGTITIKYSVGTTSGSYNAIVDFPTVDGVAGSAQPIAYTISDGSTSLNDVLKGIVSLIASINKQIAALAKLVTKK